MLPPESSSQTELLTESAMIASVSELNESSSSYSDTDITDSFTIKNLIDVRGYCHFDLPNARFKITYDELESQFAVELLSGPHIVLHVNFRFSHNVIVLNACEHGKWGHELRYENTLNDGDHFHLHIHVHDSHYTIELNGNTIGKFDHRFPYESVQALGIHGGLHVKKVSFKGFSFSKDWHHEHHQHDWGHDGYIGYGTDAYSPPQFREGHHHASYWN